MEDAECVICRDVLGDNALAVTLTCGHRFHAECLGRWRQENATCPLDRRPITHMTFDPTQLRDLVAPLLHRRRQLVELLAPYERPAPRGPLGFIFPKPLKSSAPVNILLTEYELACIVRNLRGIPLAAQFQAQELNVPAPRQAALSPPTWSIWGTSVTFFSKWFSR
jgi:hypothetical protein